MTGSSFSDASTSWPERHGSDSQHLHEPRHFLAPQVEGLGFYREHILQCWGTTNTHAYTCVPQTLDDCTRV
jgi:hypothetical protein